MTEEWCSQSEAARRLTEAGDAVSQQKISRYLERYPDLPRRAAENGKPMLVHFAALQTHRAQNIHVQEAKAPQDPAEGGDAADLRIRERRAATEIRELDLAKARNELIPRRDVETAIATAGVALEQACARSRYERRDQLDQTRDPRALLALLAEQDRAMQTAFAAALAGLGADPDAAQTDQELETEDAAPATSTA